MRSPLAVGFGLVLGMGLAQCGPITSPTPKAPPPAQDVGTGSLATHDGGALLNAIRAQNGLVALSPNPALLHAATAHAADMATNGFMGHTSSNGDTVRDRARKQGYSACLIAENVALGQGSAAEVMNAWMASPGHRKNILNGKVSEYGLARGAGNAWVLVLGQPGC